VRTFRIPVALGAITGMVAFTAWFMGWPLERTVYLAPVIVVGFAALAGLLILWIKVAVQQLRETRRPKLVLTLWLVGLGLLALLSVLGVNLPREG
jgi:hypothetical protein